MVDSSYQIFVDIDATALEGGYVYVGPAYGNPVTTPIDVFWDAAMTIPAAQPLRTSGGYIVRDGTPSEIWTAPSVYSVTVNNVAGRRVYYTAITGGELGASRVTFPIAKGPKGDPGENGGGGFYDDGFWAPVPDNLYDDGVWG